jgi:hypothetical protein
LKKAGLSGKMEKAKMDNTSPSYKFHQTHWLAAMIEYSRVVALGLV